MHGLKITLCLLSLLLASTSPARASEHVSVVPPSAQSIKMSYAPLVRKISPAVVNIYTKRVVTDQISPFANDPLFSQFFGGGFAVPRQRLESSLGSGVIIDPQGLVITNAHVIQDAAEITVALSDGREFPAKVKVRDKASDLALLKIDTGQEALPSAQLEPSETLEVGDLVIAIGNPFGVGQTVTSGIVSALARSSLSINDFNFFIQTDAAINPGNSGGPLVSMNGGVVGINSAIFSKDGGSLGIGFAIPSEMVASLLAGYSAGQVSEDGQVKRPWLGVTAQDVTADIADSVGMDKPTGALISAVHAQSPARAAGLTAGDIVIQVGEHKIHDAAEMRFRLSMIALGSEASLKIIRKGEEKILTFKSVLPPESPARETTNGPKNTPLWGAAIENLSPAVESELGLKSAPDRGVVVARVKGNSIAARFLMTGDIILEINGIRTGSVKEAIEAVQQPTRQGWIMKILSDGQTRTIVVR